MANIVHKNWNRCIGIDARSDTFIQHATNSIHIHGTSTVYTCMGHGVTICLICPSFVEEDYGNPFSSQLEIDVDS